MKKYREIIDKVVTIVLVSATLWVLVSTYIQAFKCHGKTQTELFLRIPKSFVGQWETCK